MSRKDAGRRRSPPLVIWFMLGFLVVVATTSAGLGLLAWQATQQVGVLRAELDALRGEYQAGETHLLALQNTATAMESRLATLEENDPVQQLAALQVAVETASDPQQLADLRASLSQVQTEVSGFQATLDHLSFRIDALEAVETLPLEARLTVAPQKQSHHLSCESSAASMVAQYYGVDLSEAEVLAALPLNDNPYLGFRGNVDGRFGEIEDYGVYAGPILTILNSHQELRAWPVEGGLEGIKVAIARGNPVIAWVTYDCRESTPTTATIGGSEVNLVPWQHVVVVTGYTAEGVWANDPWDGKVDFYPTEDFERAMGYFGDMAIEVSGP